MSLASVRSRLSDSGVFEPILRWTHSDASSLRIGGGTGSLSSFAAAELLDGCDATILALTADSDAAAHLHGDLTEIRGTSDGVHLLGSTGYKPYDDEQVHDPIRLSARTDVLSALTDGTARLVIVFPESLVERVPEAGYFKSESRTLTVGDAIRPDELVERLIEHEFEHVDFVEEPGQMALRGGILDIYAYTGSYPVRIDFFGDEIESIREFDPSTQRSVTNLTSTRITPNLERPEAHSARYASLLDHFPRSAVLLRMDDGTAESDTERIVAGVRDAYRRRTRPDAPPPDTLYLTAETLDSELSRFRTIYFGSLHDVAAEESTSLSARPQPNFQSDIARLKEQLGRLHAEGIDTFLTCDSPGQIGRLSELLEEEVETRSVNLFTASIHEGFEIPSARLAVYTDHQIFDRYHRPAARSMRLRRGGMTIRELSGLSPGDFVVHVDYGIGRFAGLSTITVRGKQQEAVRLHYRDEDVLYVNIAALYKLHKYSSKEGHRPHLTKLGSGQWERTKARTKKRVKDIARDLIRLYAQRKASEGHGFARDTIWQRELEASFQYEDTPDQATAWADVRSDMEQDSPMDRLVCGDVGFGKTEIAVRAAFKAVQDGKQVAVLVPTTILADQHHETFSKRLSKYPVRIASLSRFRSKPEQKEIIQNLKSGMADVVIGTHRIVSKDISFSDLGLVIVDEEQRFGVAAKEKLRQIRAEVDTLTLTATPIPRTLQFSLLGARDLSIIATPPANRQPIVTEIHTFDKNLIREAILYERTRGGQVFFIHNRVQSIEEVSATLRALLPEVRIQVAHGQMKGSDLERTMTAFKRVDFDVLVCTNIIENGLDIANANTIIVNNADRFGLSELHQLRGRVGRSDRRAFCYLLVRSVHSLTREARQRLQAVEEFTELGSGFNLAMRDLDIRGAGNLLGAEQSGFIDDVGFETYHRILDEAVQELRSDEFSSLFHEKPVPPASETTVDVETDALIPADYVENALARLNAYRHLSEARSEQQVQDVLDELHDRFGPVPEEVASLATAARMKLYGEALRLPRITLKNARLFLTLPSAEADPFFYDFVFQPLLKRLGELSNRYVLKEGRRSLRAIVQDVPNLADGERIIASLADAGVTRVEPEIAL